VPIGPCVQRFATDASAAYLDRYGRPQHPRELLSHACLRGFPSGAMTPWEFECDGEVVRVDPAGPLLVQVGAATDLAVEAAIRGTGVIYLFEGWLRPHFKSGALEPILEPWWQRFSGPFLLITGFTADIPHQAVMDILPSLFACDQAGVLQNGEVFGDGVNRQAFGTHRQRDRAIRTAKVDQRPVRSSLPL
jgi:hypothetical protein